MPRRRTPVRTIEIGITQAATSVLAFAALPILVKLGLRQHLSLWPLLLLRGALAGFCLVVLVWLAEGGKAIRRALNPGAVFLGLLFAVNSLLFFDSLRYVSASLAILLLFTHPALVVVAKRILAGEAPDIPIVAAVVSSVAGSALLVTSFHVRTTAGLVVCVAVPISYAAFLLVAERTGAGQPALATSAITLAVGVPVMAIACLVSAGSVALPATPDAGLTVLGLAACPVIGMPALVGAVRRLGAAVASIAGAAEPVVTALLAAVLLGERLTALQMVGGALIVGAALVAVGHTRTKALSAAEAADQELIVSC